MLKARLLSLGKVSKCLARGGVVEQHEKPTPLVAQERARGGVRRKINRGVAASVFVVFVACASAGADFADVLWCERVGPAAACAIPRRTLFCCC